VRIGRGEDLCAFPPSAGNNYVARWSTKFRFDHKNNLKRNSNHNLKITAKILSNKHDTHDAGWLLADTLVTITASFTSNGATEVDDKKVMLKIDCNVLHLC
jgi:hypothetical protein